MVDDDAVVNDVDNRQSGNEPIGKKIIDWTSDSAAGTVEQSVGRISGSIIALETNPDDSAVPTADYDITLEDEQGFDVLLGLGIDRHTSTTEKVQILAELTINSNTYASHPPVADDLTFKISGAGNSKEGRAIIYYR